MRPEWGYWRVLCCLVCCALSGLVAWSSCVVWLLGLVVCCVKPLSPSHYLPVTVHLITATIHRLSATTSSQHQPPQPINHSLPSQPTSYSLLVIIMPALLTTTSQLITAFSCLLVGP